MIHFEQKCSCNQGEFWECRVIPKGKYGDPWTTGCNIRIHGKFAYVSMLEGAYNRDLSAALRRFCISRGATIGHYERANGKVRTVRLEEGREVMPKLDLEMMYVARQGPPVMNTYAMAKRVVHGIILLLALGAIAGMLWLAIR